MRLALAQLNPIVGDLKGNADQIISVCKKADQQNVDLLLTPELSLWGYPPRDLLLRNSLIEMQEVIIRQIATTIAKDSPKLGLLIGVAEPISDRLKPNLFNSIALIKEGHSKIIARKQLLPTYDVFDEKRYFRPANETGILQFKIKEKTWNIAITICEDLWVDESLHGERLEGPDAIAKLVTKKVDLLINLSASPFSSQKEDLRQKLASNATNRLGCPLVYLNQVGANDELIFDGSSFVLDQHGKLNLTLPQCKEEMGLLDLPLQNKSLEIHKPTTQEQLFNALVLGVRDYAKKCGFSSALIGLSGGVDSALVTTIAVAALGAENVLAILMPSQWNPESSLKDALALAKRLGIPTEILPITDLMNEYDNSLSKPLGKIPEGITAENLQSRIRGTLLMAIANQNKHLLLSTGNKSELAVGYCTLYGDMNGGLSVIGDLYKTSVFELCRWIDSNEASQCREGFGLTNIGEIISEAIRNKAPSAELRPNQLDSDSLPDYKILDPILKLLIEDRTSTKELIDNGYSQCLIERIQGLMKKSEFKRRQAPPLLKVSNQAFGSGWRIPIATS